MIPPFYSSEPAKLDERPRELETDVQHFTRVLCMFFAGLFSLVCIGFAAAAVLL